MKKKSVIVIGAGVGGLAAAARLAHQGLEVQVFEKNAEPGGRAGRVQAQGFTFDLGPTLLLMPEVLEETFAAVGRRAEDYLELVRCDPNYRVHFRDGSSLTLTSELTTMGRRLEAFEPGSFERYLSFLSMGRRQYQTSLERFVGRNFDGLLGFFSPSNLAHVVGIRAHQKMYAEVSRYFRDERLRAALTFQTMYLGISPFESPAVYGLLPFTELAMGIWFPMGGLHAIPRALERVGQELGVRYHYQTPVRRIELDPTSGRSRGVELEDGTKVEADLVVCNADLPWAYEHLLDPAVTRLPRSKRLKYTSSAYMMYLGLRRRYEGLEHHNVVLGGAFRESFTDIFERFRVPADPSFYVNAPAHTDPSLAPEGKDGLYVLVPVPHRHPTLDWAVEGPRVRQKVFERMAELGYPDLESDIELERTVTPEDWSESLNLMHGAAFGLSHHFFQVGPFRPANVDPKVKNLFFVGASTQPGTGLPMVMLSARLTTERVLAYLSSTAAASVAGASSALQEAA